MPSESLVIPLLDLAAQYRMLQAELEPAIRRVCEDAQFVGGEAVERFEAAFAAFCGTRSCVGVNSGTDALRLALEACGIGKGDEVITVPFTFVATAEAILQTGAGVRFVDVDPITRTLDPGHLEAAITPRTRAIIPVHLYGHPAAMDPIMAIARRHGLRVIEDAAQAVGARDRGRRVGSIGDIGCLSFYPAKNLGAYGDGGAVVTNDLAIARSVRMLADHGRREKYTHERIGSNSRLDAIQAVILTVKLKHLETWNRRRRELASAYSQRLEACALAGIQVPRERAGCEAVYHLYVIETDERDRLREELQRQGIATGLHYPQPVHRQPGYQILGLGEGSFPMSEALARRVLSLPMYPELTDEQVERVVRGVREAPGVRHSGVSDTRGL